MINCVSIFSSWNTFELFEYIANVVKCVLSAHLMMAEYVETCSAATDFKKDLILNLNIVARWSVNGIKNKF
jgi:hypothetical protein